MCRKKLISESYLSAKNCLEFLVFDLLNLLVSLNVIAFPIDKHRTAKGNR